MVIVTLGLSLERVNGSFRVLVSKEYHRHWNELNEVDEQVKGPIEEKNVNAISWTLHGKLIGWELKRRDWYYCKTANGVWLWVL